MIDTNVAKAAQGEAPHADDACVDACINALYATITGRRLLVDAGDEIVGEYVGALSHAGKPGVGRAFAKWAWDSRYNEQLVCRIPISPRQQAGWRRYEEIPDLPALATFDKRDQKFVAVALASGLNPPILNAVDSDWWKHSKALDDAGIRVQWLCPQQGAKAR